MVFIHFIAAVYHIDWFVDIEKYFNPWDKSHLIMVYDPFNTLLPYGFPGSSAGKESTCIAGDLSSIPGSGRSTREGIGYPLQYSWASLVAQLVKNPPEMRGTWVQFLGSEDPLEKGMATHTSILAGRIPWTV